MNLMKKRLSGATVCIMIMLCVACIFGKGKSVSAAGSGYDDLGSWNIGDSKTITKYDVTGDGNIDSIKITVTKKVEDYSYYGILKIYVNDVLAFERSAFELHYWVVNFVSLENGKVFFDISNMVVSDDVDLHALYQYQEGKLKSFYDFNQLFGNLKYVGNIVTKITAVKKNTISLYVTGQFNVTGGITYNAKLVYKKNGFQRNADSYSILYKKKNVSYANRKNRWTTGKKIKVYKKAGGKKVAYVLKKGDVIKINKVIYKNKKIFFEVKNKKGKGKKGYIPAAMKASFPFYFKEAIFVG